MLKRTAPLLFIIFAGLIFSGCVKNSSKNLTSDSKQNKKLLINVLDMAKRPFVLINPHKSNRLITLYIDNVDSQVRSSTLDIEYLAGNLLKGGRVSLNFPLNMPYGQAFLLGSCSTGGKCSFDKNLTSGTIKNRLEIGKETHILKTNFVFINGETTTPDGKITFTPDKKDTQILVDTQGLPSLNGVSPEQIVLNPFAITSVDADPILGDIKIRAKAQSALIFNGSKYLSIDITQDGDFVLIKLNQKPWQKKLDIIRDDKQGTTESTTVNVTGPIVLLK